MTASGLFSIFIFNDDDISDKNTKYAYTRNVFNKFQRT